jgi:hypothetical protein
MQVSLGEPKAHFLGGPIIGQRIEFLQASRFSGSLPKA